MGQIPVDAPASYDGEEDTSDNKPSGPKFTSKTVVVASLVASGYTIGQSAWDKAMAYDRSVGISEKILTKLQEIDSKFGVTDRAKHLADIAKNIASDLDSKYNVTETVTQAGEKGKDLVKKGVNWARSYSTIEGTLNTLQALALQAREEGKFLVSETQRQIEAKKNTNDTPTTESTSTESATPENSETQPVPTSESVQEETV